VKELIENLKHVLASTFALRLKTQYYHWNCEGPDFIQMHDFFGDLYKELDKEIDTIGELVRSLDAYAPGSFKRLTDLSYIKCDDTVPSCEKMVGQLLADYKTLKTVVTATRDEAEKQSCFSCISYLEEYLVMLDKRIWMLRSISKNT